MSEGRVKNCAALCELPWPSDILDWFGVFARLPDPIFLDSAQYHETLGRYSFMAADPFSRLTLRGDQLFHDDCVVMVDVFSYLSSELAKYRQSAHPGLPPFQGGVMGYIGYGVGRLIEKLPPSKAKSGEPDLDLGFYDCVLALDHLEKRAFLFSTGFPLTGQAKEKRAQARLDDFVALLKVAPPAYYLHPPPIQLQPQWRKDQYETAVAKAIEYVTAGDIYQANVSQLLQAARPANLNLPDLYVRLRRHNPAPFAGYMQSKYCALISASPERFLRLQDGLVETRPIKGTRPRKPDANEDRWEAESLLTSAKDRAENLMIVDLLRNDLSRVTQPGSVQVPKLCGLESYATVHHLVSVVTAEMQNDKNAVDLLRASFPGGSITGAPKIRAMEIIHELETAERGPYCGSMLWLGFDGAMDSNIIIRTLVIDDLNISLRTGCGIVAESDPSAEYQESLDKARVFVELLGHDLA